MEGCILWLQPVDLVNKYHRRKSEAVKLVEEDLSDILNLKYLSDWLKQCYGGLWSEIEVKRCLDVFQTLAEVSIEWDVDIFYEPAFKQCSVWYEPKRKVMKRILESPGVAICSNKDCASYGSEAAMLIKIIRDECEYNKFCCFWKVIPSIRQVFEVLCKIFGKDISKLILNKITLM